MVLMPKSMQKSFSLFKIYKVPKYGIWAMMKNKEPNLFIKQFKDIFKKIITIPIENENGSMKANDLYRIALKIN